LNIIVVNLLANITGCQARPLPAYRCRVLR
jgi:hypothetical protein